MIRLRIGLSLVGLAALLVLGTPTPLRAEETAQGDWELAPLAEPAVSLFTPSSGPLFVRITSSLLRSNDAGASWAPVPLPPQIGGRVGKLAIDPTNHAVIYAEGEGGLYKTSDDAASWQLIFPRSTLASRIVWVAVSPADQSLVYLLTSSGGSTGFQFGVSRDGGATWQQSEPRQGTLCDWSAYAFEPHPTNPARIFGTIGCYAGRNIGDALQHSADFGATWTKVVAPEAAFPARVVGGRGSAPARLYLAANRDYRAGGSFLLRSDDDGASWTELLAHKGGGGMMEPDAPNVTIGGLTYDPARPERVYAALNVTQKGSPRTGGIKLSIDAGQSWSDLGRQDIGPFNDLALGIDGRMIFATTDRGVWRLRLP